MDRFVLALLTFFPILITGQTVAPGRVVSENAEEFRAGVVVEKVAKNSDAERAGLREGDVLLIWNLGRIEDEIKSPLDLYDIEAEEKSQGAVRLRGLRNGEERAWTMGPGAWGIQGRPYLPERLLSLYREGQELAKSGKPTEASGRFREAAALISKDRPDRRWVEQWLLLQAADTLAAAEKSREADALYQDVFQWGEVSKRGATYLLWAWAGRFSDRRDGNHAQNVTPGGLDFARSLNNLGLAARARGDLAKAEEYYLRALAIEEELVPGGLEVANSLNNLGIVAGVHGDLLKAADYHRRALVIEQELLPDSLDAAASLTCLGIAVGARGDLQKADDYLRQALEIEQKLAPGGLDITVVTLTKLGRHAWNRLDEVAADTYLQQAAAIQEKLYPGSLALANNLATLGLVALDRGDLAKAEHYHQEALMIRQKRAAGGLGVAKSLSSLALILRSRGDLAKAEQYLRQALAIKQSDESSAGILANLGLVLLDRDDLEQADECFSESLRIYEKLDPGSLEVAGRLNNLGSVATVRGDLVKAENYQRQALTIQEKLAPGSLESSWSLNNLGNVLSARGDSAGAEQYYRRALAIRENLAPDSLNVARTLNSLAEEIYQHYPAEAEKYYRRALVIEQKLAPESWVRAESLAGLATILRGRGQMDQAAQLFEQALHSLEGQTDRLGGSDEVRSGFRASNIGFYKDYIHLLIEQKQPEQALSLLERSRARSLLETLAAAHVDIRKGVSPKLLEQERTLQAEMASKTDRRIELFAEKHTEEQVVAIDKELKELLHQYQAVEDEIRVNSPAYAALTQPKPLLAKEIQQQVLDPGILLLEYTLGEERSYVFAVTPTSLAAYELPKRIDIEAAARPVYDMLAARSRIQKGETAAQRTLRLQNAEAQYPEAASKLSRMILGPVATLMQGKRLLIVSDGILEYVPFAALPSPAQAAQFTPLVVNHEIVNLPSASVLQLLRQQNAARTRAAKAVAVVADPVFQGNDSRVRSPRMMIATTGTGSRKSLETAERPTSDSDHLLRSAGEVGALDGQTTFSRLLFSRKEADAILKEAPPGGGMKALDFNASLATVASPELSRYRIVHFATHGLLNSRHPELSGLVLSLVDEHGRTRPGFLALEAIYNLTLPADMVVLSACETGLGKEVQGEGLVGITRGFMYAGATRVVASLWKVNDAATADLMERFYRGIFKDRLQPAAALRRAQVEMWKHKRWSLPYYWAGFVIQGEW
jgi:CHAT domain-containing protein/Tfp pilus assembly protein PilF